MVSIDARLIANAVADRAKAVTNAVGYFGQVGRDLNGKLIGDPQPKSKDDQRVRDYYVLFPGFGGPSAETDLGDCLVDLEVPFGVTVAGGDAADVLGLSSRLHDQLYRWAPGRLGTAPEVFTAGPLRVPPGYRAPLLTDTSVRPTRVYVPLQYVLTAHT